MSKPASPEVCHAWESPCLANLTGALAIFWACKGGRAADFVAFDCMSQEKAAHGHVVYAVQEGVKNSVNGGPKTAAIVPEMSVVL